MHQSNNMCGVLQLYWYCTVVHNLWIFHDQYNFDKLLLALLKFTYLWVADKKIVSMLPHQSGTRKPKITKKHLKILACWRNKEQDPTTWIKYNFSTFFCFYHAKQNKLQILFLLVAEWYFSNQCLIPFAILISCPVPFLAFTSSSICYF